MNSKDNFIRETKLLIRFYLKMLLIFVLLLSISYAISSSVTLSITYLNGTNNDKLAVCQDGTPAIYYFKGYTDVKYKDVWLFHLQGGGQCYSQTTCANRSTAQKSSTSAASTISEHGIFDGDIANSPLYAANKVFVTYCSSDGWVGDSEPTDLTWGWNFRGQRIIRAALKDLIDKNLIQANCNMVFSGGSAGGRGMMNNVDYIVDMLPSGCKARAYLDSPFYIDYPTYSPGTIISLMDETKEVYARYNVSAVIPPECAARYPGDEGWKCLYGQYRIPFVKTQHVLVASVFDEYQLNHDTGMDPPNTIYPYYPNEDLLNYALKWSQQTIIELTQVIQDHVVNKRNNWIVSWACYNHDVCLTSPFGICGASPSNMSEYKAVEALFNDQINSPALWLDQCDGFACGKNCYPSVYPSSSP